MVIAPGITFTLAWEAELPDGVGPSYRRASGVLKVSLDPTGARLEGTRDVAVDAEALEDFYDSVSHLLDTLTGSAKLEPTIGPNDHGSFAITIMLDHGKAMSTDSLPPGTTKRG